MYFTSLLPPLFFNPVEENSIKKSPYAVEYQQIEDQYVKLQEQKKQSISELLKAVDQNENNRIKSIQSELNEMDNQSKLLKNNAIDLIKENNPKSDGNDTNYIFLNFVLGFLPVGLIGLVLAAILSASMSSTSAELNALASTSVIDIYKRLYKNEGTDRHFLIVSKLASFWLTASISLRMSSRTTGDLTASA